MTGVGLGYDSVVSKRGQHSDNKEGEVFEEGVLSIYKGLENREVSVLPLGGPRPSSTNVKN